MASITLTQPEIYRPSRLTLLFRYMRRNIGLGIGFFILLLLVAFTLYGLATADLSHAYPSECEEQATSQLGISTWYRFFWT